MPAPRIAAREARARLRRVEDTGDAEAWSRALANAWMDWAPLLAVRGGLDGITAGALNGDAAGTHGEVPSPSHGAGDRVESAQARQLARWLETAAAAASAERTGGHGATAAASERLAHALVAVGLLVGRAGLAGGGESGDAHARAALRNRTADALVPALGSRSRRADLAASIAACTIGGHRWGAEHAALLDGSLALRDEGASATSARSVVSGVASLTAALVAAEPAPAVGFGGTRPGLARVLRTCEHGRTEDASVGALAVIRDVLETAAPGDDVVAGRRRRR